MSCHGGVKQMGQFSLLFEEEAFRMAESGQPAIIPGDAYSSELYKRIVHHDQDMRMPKDGAALSLKEKELIASWIENGAKWEEHWAYIPPTMPMVPTVENPWPRNEIDHFVWNKLYNEGLVPAEEAEKAILLRRASLDLTGLPPDPQLLGEFLSDTSSYAYEAILDQLLSSQHFGERWASMWLDLARYADSKGYEKDGHRDMWRYRDWVIQAFNEDKPFDEFTIEQLAGDMLPYPSQDQLIATAFNRNTMTNEEGGTSDEEFRLSSVMDRMNTTFEIWQGTTLGCVQCHSHPYDPIKHEEFYQVMDIFNHSLDNDLSSEIPNLYLYEEEKLTEIQETIARIESMDSRGLIDKNAPLSQQIRQAAFPFLDPSSCDDFHNTVFGQGFVTNWAQNLQEIGDNKFQFKFSDMDLTGLADISYAYFSHGEDACVEVRLDNPEGPIINVHQFEKTRKKKVSRWQKDKFPIVKTPVSTTKGTHDLIFELVNTSGEIPDGMITLGTIKLGYEGQKSPSRKLEEYKTELLKFQYEGDKTPIMREKSETFQRTTHMFERGNWMVQGKQVFAKVPHSFVSEKVTQPTNRLEFAQWLVSTDNPLTARVMVNRFWEQIFGTGIIESLEDFGTQGLEASHPELLDYLAIQFMHKHSWSVKELLKEILLSATYRQSSKLTPQKLEKDPYNRLLSRGPRFRLSAEQIRDQALAVSGLLNDSIGGKSVMPLQPDGIWQVVYNNQRWVTPDDSLDNRRGLYTYWKRTTPYPSMAAFDSPSREFCVSRRIRTNTPLQALVTLNDPVYLKAAQALAESMKDVGGDNLEEALKYGYTKALLQEADSASIGILTNLFRHAQDEICEPLPQIVEEPDSVSTYDFHLTEPMTVVANAIMNLDGFIMKE